MGFLHNENKTTAGRDILHPHQKQGFLNRLKKSSGNKHSSVLSSNNETPMQKVADHLPGHGQRGESFRDKFVDTLKGRHRPNTLKEKVTNAVNGDGGNRRKFF
jgi:hypothetical protein